MGQFCVIGHESLGQHLHIRKIAVGPVGPFGLPLDRDYAQTKRLFDKVQVALDNIGHFALRQIDPACIMGKQWQAIGNIS